MRVPGSLTGPKRQPRRGAAAVELAILLAPLTFLLMMAIDFARVFFPTMTVTNCARNGALYGSDPAGVSKYASVTDAALADGTSLSNPALTSSNVASASGTDANGNPYVDVTVTYKFPMVTSYLIASKEIDLSYKVRMRVAPTVPD
jgi:Flp pilus assembly protein TadG